MVFLYAKCDADELGNLIEIVYILIHIMYNVLSVGDGPAHPARRPNVDVAIIINRLKLKKVIYG